MSIARSEKKRNKRISAANEMISTLPVGSMYWLVPCFFALFLYLRVINFDFIFDDQTLIVLNPQVHSWDYLPRLLTTHLWSHRAQDTIIPQYRPIFSVWLLIMYTVAGVTQWLWHLSSVLLHTSVTYVVYRVGLEVLENAETAGVTALLFAVHPIHVEPVSWISSCNELIYTLLVLLSLLIFIQTLRRAQPELSWNRGTIGSAILWTAAIFTKESALPVLAVFFYLAYMSNASLALRQRFVTTVRLVAPYLAAVFLYFGARFLAIGKVGLDRGGHTWGQVLYTAPSILLFYLKKLTVPIGLSGFYMNPLFSAPTAIMWPTVALMACVVGIFAWISVRKSRSIGFASLLLFFPMVPVLIGIKVFLDGDLAHDRYMYLPSVGLSFFAGIVLKFFLLGSKPRRAAALGVTTVLTVLFSWFTLAQQGIYRDEKTYFGRGLEVAPDNVLVIDYLGNSYLRDGQMSQALQLFVRAHELKPDNAKATFCLARGLVKDGQFGASESYLERLTRSEDLTRYRRNMVFLMLGQTEMNLDHPDRAESVFKQLVSEDPSAHGTHYSLGYLYQSERRFSEAQDEYQHEYQISQSRLAAQRALYLSRLTHSGMTDRSRSTLGELHSSRDGATEVQAPFAGGVD